MKIIKRNQNTSYYPEAEIQKFRNYFQTEEKGLLCDNLFISIFKATLSQIS